MSPEALRHDWLVYRSVSGAPRGWRCGSCDDSTATPDDALCPARVAAALDRAHNEAIEAAAKVCEDETIAPDGPGRIFRALNRIRALKRKE